MKYLRSITLTLTILLIVLGVLVGFAYKVQFVQAQEQPGPITEYIIYRRVEQDKVPDAMVKDIDAYIYGVRPEQVKLLQGRPDVTIYFAPALITDFFVNPAPVYTVVLNGTFTKAEVAAKYGVPEAAITYIEVIKINETASKTYVEFGAFPDKGINPFAFKEVRFALNYLIDREYAVKNIYAGFAAPMYACYSLWDPMYSVIADIVAAYKFSYSPALADELMTKALTAAGAKKEEGRWYYDGKPIRLKFVIRTEDERKDLGDMLATELERLGFEVDRMYMEFGEAISTAYFTDPAEHRWHLYTEGWSKSAIDRWDPWQLAQFHAPWVGFMPGMLVPDWWNYRNSTIDELTQNLCLGKFSSKEQYVSEFRKAVEMSLQEAVRVWIAMSGAYPVVSSMKGITLDLGAGLRPLYNVREWYIPGNDTIRIGHRHIWSSRTTWNVFGGFTDVYSVDIQRITYDFWIARHPFNGEPIAFRTPFKVVTAGPNGKLNVPTDAVIWDAENDRWVNVEPGTKATSKVVFDLSKLIGTDWHYGLPITWADVLAYWAEWFEICYDSDKSGIEPSIAEANRPLFDIIRGIRILPDEKKLEVYIDFWHFDKNYIADAAAIGLPTANPAELLIAQDYIAFVKKTYALSDSRSRTAQIPQLNLALSNHAEAVKEVLEEWLKDGFFPRSMFTVNNVTYMSEDEWKARINTLISWIDKYNNAWVSNGPYMLIYFDKDKEVAKLQAFRDPTYPFRPGTWVFGIPRPVKITEVGIPVVSPGDKATITISVTGEPPIHIKYVLRDPITNEIIAEGEASQVTPTTFRIDLSSDVTSKLKEYSAYELIVLALSDAVAMPDETTRTLTTGAALSQKFEEVSRRFEEVGKSIEEISSRVEEISTSLSAKVAEVSKTLGEALKTSMSELSSALKTSLSQLSDTLSSSLSTMSSDISSVKSSVSDLSSRMDELSDKVTSLEEAMKGISGAFTTLEALLIVVVILQITAIVLGLRKK